MAGLRRRLRLAALNDLRGRALLPATALAARLAALAVLAAGLATVPAPAGERGAEPGTFDFYVLSLSWSPSYCALEGDSADRRQCAGPRRHGFVVHGLWPQYERGYPEFCRSRLADRVPRALGEQFFDIMPGMGLIGHQWRKHGTCSGLRQDAYFALVRQARERVAVPDAFARADTDLKVDPDALEAAFGRANPGLPAEAIAVTCDGRFIEDVRICLTRALDFRPCREVDRRACRRDAALMPAAR